MPFYIFSILFIKLSKWFGMFNFLEISACLFYGTFDFIKTWVRTFKAHWSRFFYYLFLMIYPALPDNTVNNLSRKSASTLNWLAPF